MKLYYFETPNGRKACAVAKYLGSPVEYVKVDLAKGEQKEHNFLAINPNGKVPVLQDGGFCLWESPAIMIHLAQKAGSDLWPGDTESHIEVVKWLSWDTAHFSRHAGRLFWENYVKPEFGLGETNREEVEDASGYFKQFAQVLDDHLKGKSHIIRNQLTITDFAVASLLPMAKEAQLPLDGFGEIKRWHDGLLNLPAWREPFPA